MYCTPKVKFFCLTFGVQFIYVTFSSSRSVRCETKELPVMRVCIEGYTKKTPNAIQLRCSSQL